MLAIDATKAVRSGRARKELVTAVRDAPANEQETSWLEWKSSLNLSSRPGQVVVAKAVLGFSNRNPDVAVRAMEGCAYLVVGAEPTRVIGVVPIDQATLEAQVNVYVGHNLDWDVDYVELDGETVLVVTVEPPRWGDPIHPVRKAYQPHEKGGTGVPAGAILVRHSASTERASPADIDMLSKRCARQPGSELDIEVRPVEGAELGRVDCRPEVIDDYVSQEGQALVAHYRPPGAINAKWLGGAESRSEEMYLREIAAYGKELRKALPGVLLARSVEHDVGLLRLEAVNHTDTTFIGVQVEVTVPAPFRVCIWKQELLHPGDLPKSPAPFGQQSLRALDYTVGWNSIGMPQLRPAWLPRLQQTDQGSRVVFDPRDVRARGATKLTDVWLLLDHEAPPIIELRWEATAKNARKRLEGVVSVPVRGELASPEELLANPTLH